MRPLPSFKPRRLKRAIAGAAAVALAFLFVDGQQPLLAEPLRPGKVGILVATRNGTGPTDGSIGFGYGFGFDAAWQPMEIDQRLGFGINWSLIWTYYGAEAGARVTDTLSLLELDAGVRARLALILGRPQYLTVGVGAGLLRANAPIPPDNDRGYFGVYGSVGYEHGVWNSLLLSAEFRYGFIGSEPVLATLLVGVGVSL